MLLIKVFHCFHPIFAMIYHVFGKLLKFNASNNPWSSSCFLLKILCVINARYDFHFFLLLYALKYQKIIPKSQNITHDLENWKTKEKCRKQSVLILLLSSVSNFQAYLNVFHQDIGKVKKVKKWKRWKNTKIKGVYLNM